MNIDLTPLTAWLSSLGPWGYVAAIALTLLAPKLWAMLKAKVPGLPAIPSPAPQPNAPVVVPADPLANRPVLGMGLAILRELLAKNNPGQDPDTLLVSHVLTQVGGQVIVPVTEATTMTGPRVADRKVQTPAV